MRSRTPLGVTMKREIVLYTPGRERKVQAGHEKSNTTIK